MCSPSVYPKSDTIAWHLDIEEHFNFMMSCWDVRAAKRLIAAKPRPIATFSLDADVAAQAKRTVVAEADAPVDLTIPLVVVQTPEGNVLPIDGWHRIAKAVNEGVTELPAVYLTKSESRKVRWG